MSRPAPDSPATEARAADQPAAAHPPAAAPRLAAFRYRNYRWYWLGQLAANIGTWMQMVAVGWLVLELTDSAAYLGFNAAIQGVPIVVFALAGGVIADRVDRYRLMLGAQVCQCVLEVALAVLVGTGTINVVQIFVYSFLVSVVSGLTTPARQAFVPRLVPRDALTSAVALNSSLWNAGAVLGPTLAGLILAAGGLAWPIYLTAACGVLNLGAMLMIRVPAEAPRPTTHSPWASLVQGARYVAYTADLRTLLLATGALCVLGRPYTQFMPAFARDVYGVGPEGLGVMLTMPSIGAIAAVVAIGVSRNLDAPRWFLWTGTATALALVAFAAAPTYGVALVLLVVLGATGSAAITLAQTLVLQLGDDAMRGRVMGYYMAATWGGWRLGSFPTGLLAEILGTPWAVGVGAVLLLVAQLPIARSHLVRAGPAPRTLAADAKS